MTSKRSGVRLLTTARVVAVELIVLGAAFAVFAQPLSLRLIGVVTVVVGCGGFPWHDRTLFGRGFAAVGWRRQEIRAAEEGSFTVEPPRRASEPVTIEHSATLEALFPGVLFQDLTDDRGQQVAIVRFGQSISLAFALRGLTEGSGLPMTRVAEVMQEAYLPDAAVTWFGISPFAAPENSALRRLRQESSLTPLWGSYLTLRLSADSLALQADLHGGYEEGLTAAMTALASRVERELERSGWASRRLNAAALADEVGSMLRLDGDDEAFSAQVGRSSILTSGARHVTLALARWSDEVNAAFLMELAKADGAVVMMEVRRGREVRVLARMMKEEVSSRQDIAKEALRTFGRDRWHVVNGSQLEALRATTLVGAGEV